jgi:hypothetical protein
MAIGKRRNALATVRCLFPSSFFSLSHSLRRKTITEQEGHVFLRLRPRSKPAVKQPRARHHHHGYQLPLPLSPQQLLVPQSGT